MNNQITIEGLTKNEIIGAIQYTKKCLMESFKMEAWEIKEYKATLEHFTGLLNRFNAISELLETQRIESEY